MNTRAAIIQIADSLIREKGFNAFSFSDISNQLNIKNASVHYHFATKTALGVAVIKQQILQLELLKEKAANKPPLEKLQAFFSIYTNAKKEDKICLVGSLATDLYTVNDEIQAELKNLVNRVLKWVTAIVEQGKAEGTFRVETDARTKALMIITNMLAAVQLTRITGRKDFAAIKQTIISELTAS